MRTSVNRSALYKSSLDDVVAKGKSIDDKLTPEIVFALERTLAAWVVVAGSISYAGSGLINGGERAFGAVLMALAALTLGWSFLMYYKRLSWLEKQDNVSVTHNRIPVIIICLVLVVSLFAGYILTILTGAAETVTVTNTASQ